MVQTNNSVATAPVLKFFGYLRFYGTGAYRRVVGRRFGISMSQQSMSRVLEEVTYAMVNTLANEWICAQQRYKQKMKKKQRFMEAFNLPGMIGAVDCIHIEILRLVVEDNYVSISMSQQSMSRVLEEVTSAMVNTLANEWICSQQRYKQKKTEIYGSIQFTWNDWSCRLHSY
uniref:Nuclease HARBI1 n=1 Tax=Diabrotica virgifera virgifera TaxID=50390 RepID=A0A6P7GV86_DIAVI